MKGLIGRVTVALCCLAGFGTTVDASLAGAVAPDFVLKSADGHNYRLSEYRGSVVLVSFWASWCRDCRSQLEALEEIHSRYPDVGLQLLAVSPDRELTDVSGAAEDIGFEFPALHDAGGHISEQYAVGSMPYMVLIDQQGVVRFEHAGFDPGDEEQFLQQARALLNE